MPWANGQGSTTEILRHDDAEGRMLWRLSMAVVAVDGAFSMFDGIERVLTVIEGPGFDLAGAGVHLRADPLEPVAFAGDIAIAAQNVTAPLVDFNVMVARRLGAFDVRVLQPGLRVHAAGGPCAVFALEAGTVSVDATDIALARHGLWLGDSAEFVENSGGVAQIFVQFPVAV